jgi:hypothetical protein
MTMQIRQRTGLIATAVAIAAIGLCALMATTAQAALRHFDGTVTSKSTHPREFTIRTENGNKVTFRVNRATEFERIDGGFKGLEDGLAVEVDAKSKDGGFTAKQVEKDRNHGGGGNGGGGGGNDDPPGHH